MLLSFSVVVDSSSSASCWAARTSSRGSPSEYWLSMT